MNRAAAFTFAASLAVTSGALSSACGGVVETGSESNDDAGGGQTMYGIARADDGGVSDSGGIGPMYGIAITDAGPEDGGGIGPMYGIAITDAGPPDDGGIVAAYGLPRPP